MQWLNVLGLGLDFLGAMIALFGPRVRMGRMDDGRYIIKNIDDFEQDRGMKNFLADKRRSDRIVQIGSSLVLLGLGCQLFALGSAVLT